jgi:hypothetical protein
MIVRTTSLAMRFYKEDGWNEDILLSLVDENGHCAGFKYFDDEHPYWIPEVGTNMDIERLMQFVTKVHRGFNDVPSQTDKEHLESKNW